MIITYKFGPVTFTADFGDIEVIEESKYSAYHFTSGLPKADYTIRVRKTTELAEKVSHMLPDFTGASIKYRTQSHDRIYESVQAPYAFFHRTGEGEYLLDYSADDPYCMRTETNFWNCTAVESLLLDHRCMILHAAYIRISVKDGAKGLLFFAPSGTGKSTQAELWEKYRDARIINGDRALLSPDSDTLLAHGLPFCGSSEYYVNCTSEVMALIYLRQGQENSVRRLSAREAITRMFSECTINNWDPHAVDQALSLLQSFYALVPIYEFSCTPDEAAVTALAGELKLL